MQLLSIAAFAINIQYSIASDCYWVQPGRHCYDPIDAYGISVGNLLCNESATDRQIFNETFETQCVECYMPHHCLENSVCEEGSAGPTCERCLHSNEASDSIGYLAIGSGCLKCDRLPWTGIAMAIVFVPTISVMIWFKGFTVSIYTKLKLLVNFIQLALVTLSVRKQWPELFLQFLNFGLGYTACNDSLILNQHMIEWCLNTAIPITLLILVVSIDRHMEYQIADMNDVDVVQLLWKRKNRLRRATMLLLLSFFMPVLVNCLRSLACAALIPTKFSFGDRDSFLFDQDENLACSDVTFQILNLLLTILTVGGCVFGVPVLLLFAMRIYKWDLFPKFKLQHGSIFESFEKRCCAWEAIIFIRKIFCAVLTEIYPLGAKLVSTSLVTLTALYLLAALTLRPYRKFTWSDKARWIDAHNVFEVFANSTLLFFQVVVLLQSSMSTDDYSAMSALDVVAIALLAATLVLWLLLFCLTPIEIVPEDEEVIVPLLARRKSRVNEFWVRNKAGEGLDLMELQARQRNLNF